MLALHPLSDVLGNASARVRLLMPFIFSAIGVASQSLKLYSSWAVVDPLCPIARKYGSSSEGENAMAFTGPSVLTRSTALGHPVSSCQTRTVPSFEADATSRSVGDNAKSVIYVKDAQKLRLKFITQGG